MDRVGETQLQVGENSNWIIWRLKGYSKQVLFFFCALQSKSAMADCTSSLLWRDRFSRSNPGQVVVTNLIGSRVDKLRPCSGFPGSLRETGFAGLRRIGMPWSLHPPSSPLTATLKYKTFFWKIVPIENLSRQRAGALVQWSKLPVWKVGHRGFEQYSKKQNVSSPSLVKIQYSGEPPWPKDSVQG